MTGGRGADRFWVGNSLSNSPSIIADFQVGTDVLQIQRLGATFDNLTVEDTPEEQR